MCCVHTVPVPQIALFLLIDSADLCFFFCFDAEFLFTWSSSIWQCATFILFAFYRPPPPAKRNAQTRFEP